MILDGRTTTSAGKVTRMPASGFILPGLSFRMEAKSTRSAEDVDHFMIKCFFGFMVRALSTLNGKSVQSTLAMTLSCAHWLLQCKWATSTEHL